MMQLWDNLDTDELEASGPIGIISHVEFFTWELKALIALHI